MVLWLQFIACTAIILVLGIYLSKYGDIIVEKTVGPLLVQISRNHLVSSISVIIALAIAVIGLIYRADKKPLFFVEFLGHRGDLRVHSLLSLHDAVTPGYS